MPPDRAACSVGVVGGDAGDGPVPRMPGSDWVAAGSLDRSSTRRGSGGYRRCRPLRRRAGEARGSIPDRGGDAFHRWPSAPAKRCHREDIGRHRRVERYGTPWQGHPAVRGLARSRLDQPTAPIPGPLSPAVARWRVPCLVDGLPLEPSFGPVAVMPSPGSTSSGGDAEGPFGRWQAIARRSHREGATTWTWQPAERSWRCRYSRPCRHAPLRPRDRPSEGAQGRPPPPRPVDASIERAHTRASLDMRIVDRARPARGATRPGPALIAPRGGSSSLGSPTSIPRPDRAASPIFGNRRGRPY